MLESVSLHGSRHHYERGMIEGSWSGMKKRLEEDLLCPALRGRVSYHFTRYSKFGSSGNCASISLDGLPVKKFGFLYSVAQLKKKDLLRDGQLTWDIPMAARDEYEDWEFAQALKAFRNQPIHQSIASDDPIVRMFAIVDRRVGKRTLHKLHDMLDDQPEWLRLLYIARMEAEGIVR